MSKLDKSLHNYAPSDARLWDLDASQINLEAITVPQHSGYHRFGKRALDIGLTLISLPLSAPLILALCFISWLTQGAMPIYGHRRIGKDGVSFTCWKLRSMVPAAEQRLQEHLARNPQARREWAETFKLTNDPRVTWFGGLLRRTSLDELPQLWNVLMGEMSLVGPRPVTAQELPKYGAFLHHYQSLRPGVTGMWQVNGRNAISYDDRVAMDVAYARGFDLQMDIGILFKTLRAVVTRTGC